MSRNRRPLTAGLTLVAAFMVLPAGAQAADDHDARQRLPEEITITGQKLFSTLHQQIREAEDRMYGLFNELNSDDLYDIHCVWEAPLGTRIKQRNCRPEFYDRASEENAEAYLAQVRGESGSNVAPVNAQLANHYPILQARMQELIRQNPDLLQAVLNFNALHEELQARKSSYFARDK